MASVNKVILIGNLGKDPEMRNTTSGSSVASFSISTTERYTDKSGTKQESTEWHNIVAYGKLAEICSKYLTKGKPIYLEGRLHYASWEKDGQTKSRTEIVANEIKMLGSKQDRVVGPATAGVSSNGQPESEELPF